MEFLSDLEKCFEEAYKHQGIKLRDIEYTGNEEQKIAKGSDFKSRWPKPSQEGTPDGHARADSRCNDEKQWAGSFRSFSVSQPGSHHALDASSEDFHALVKAEAISEDIYSLVLNFCERSRQTEEAFVSPSFQNRFSEEIELGYVFKYPELRKRNDSGAQWSIRQTGVYSKIGPVPRSPSKSIWLFLHPTYKAEAETRLNVALDDAERSVSLIRDPVEVHKLVMQSYIGNWRPYLKHVEEELLEIAMPLLGDPDEKSVVLCTEKLVRIRYLEGLVQPSIPIFASTLRVLSNIGDLYATSLDGEDASLNLKKTADTVHNLMQQIHSYASYAESLLCRLACTAQLFSDGLALKNHRTVLNQSAELAKMTHATTQDSATIRVITAVTVVFLPTTSVATLFGTEVLYLSDDHRLQASPHFWIFVAVSVVLTVLTIVFWRLRKWRYEWERRPLSVPREMVDLEKGGNSRQEKSFVQRIKKMVYL